MTINKLKLGLNIVFKIRRLVEWRSLGWKELHLGLFWLHTMPHESCRFTRKNYYGFWFRVKFWLPFEIGGP